MVIIEVGVDRLNQVGNTFEHTPANPFVGNFSEPTLDQIQPRTGSGNKVQMEPRMACEPGCDPRMFVGAVIVDNGCLPSAFCFFSGSLYVVSLADIRWLGAVTPIGGLAFLADWIFLGWRIWRDACPHVTGGTT